MECQFELTDTLAYYLCSRKPDHRSGQHFIIPEMADSVDVTELAKAARQKLQAVCIYFAISNKLVLYSLFKFWALLSVEIRFYYNFNLLVFFSAAT